MALVPRAALKKSRWMTSWALMSVSSARLVAPYARVGGSDDLRVEGGFELFKGVGVVEHAEVVREVEGNARAVVVVAGVAARDDGGGADAHEAVEEARRLRRERSMAASGCSREERVSIRGWRAWCRQQACLGPTAAGSPSQYPSWASPSRPPGAHFMLIWFVLRPCAKCYKTTPPPSSSCHSASTTASIPARKCLRYDENGTSRSSAARSCDRRG